MKYIQKMIVVNIYIMVSLLLLCAAGFSDIVSEPVSTLVYLQPDGKVFLAIPDNDKINVRQISIPEQNIENIAVALNGKCVWAIDRTGKSNGQFAEGWNKYGPLDVFLLDPAKRKITLNSLCTMMVTLAGDRLAYISENKKNRSYNLVIENLLTGETKIISKSWSYLQMPSWSRDGSKIAYFASSNSDGYCMHVYDTKSDSDIVVSPPTLKMNFNGNIMDQIIWSIDNKMIYFTSAYKGFGNFGNKATYMVPAIGGIEPKKITDGRCLTLSSDGKILSNNSKAYRIENEIVEQVAFLPEMKGNLSPNSKVIVYTGQNGGLWCRILSNNYETEISEKWWHDMRVKYHCAWTVIESATY